MKNKKFLIFLFIFSTFLFSITVSAQDKNVLVVEINETINQSTVEKLTEALNQAENENSEAVILQLNTPGGGLQQTFDIANLINDSDIPVIGYVSPQGSHAWSAGTFILISTHLSAMSDHTIIGSCQPIEVTPTGTNLINDSKTINALTKWIETRAEMYDRNKSIVKKFVTNNLNLNETKALEYKVIEHVSSNTNQLLEDIDGETVKTNKGNVTLQTSNAEQIKYSPSVKIIFMEFFSNPILVSLLFMFGVFAIIFGISSPGFGAEVFGIIAILLSLVGSGFSIPVLSIIFISIGVLLFVIELYVTPGFGLVGIGGIISLLIGSIFLIPSYPNREWLVNMDWIQDALIVVIAAVVILAIFFLFLLYKIIKVRKQKNATNVFVGKKAVASDRITPDKPGYVKFKGEYWKAISDETIEVNTKVIIVERDESTLKVKSRDS
jgi:membrane-bound serine protease (ClpP class)